MVPAPMRIAMVDPTRTPGCAAGPGRAVERSPVARPRRSPTRHDGPRETAQRGSDVQPQVLPWLKARMTGASVSGDQHGAGEVDGPRPVGVARLATVRR